MRFIVFVKATKETEAGVMPSQQLISEMGAFNEQLINAGVMTDGGGLRPSSKAARVQFDGKNRNVIDGPFTETKELVAGFWMWNCKSLAEAIEWVKKCPNPTGDIGTIEIRPMFDETDFAK